MSDDDGLGRSLDAALVALVASLRSWGVEDAHWLRAPHGAPVLWLRTATEAQRAALAEQGWLPAQVHVTLSRLGVPHDVLRTVRTELSSTEGEDRLFTE